MNTLEALYKTNRHEKYVFGDKWEGPETFRHGEYVTVAKYPRTNGDGQAVTVACSAWPARFYRITAQPEDGKPGYTIGLGSGMLEAANQIAGMIASGMMTVGSLCTCKPLDSVERRLLDDSCPVHGEQKT